MESNMSAHQKVAEVMINYLVRNHEDMPTTDQMAEFVCEQNGINLTLSTAKTYVAAIRSILRKHNVLLEGGHGMALANPQMFNNQQSIAELLSIFTKKDGRLRGTKAPVKSEKGVKLFDPALVIRIISGRVIVEKKNTQLLNLLPKDSDVVISFDTRLKTFILDYL